MTTDLQAAMDNIDIDSGDSVVTIVAGVHQALRQRFAEFKAMMEDDVETRIGLAQAIGMQLELHIESARETPYEVLAPRQPDLMRTVSQAQQDVQEAIAVLRPMSKADAALDATMLRLMQLSEYFMDPEKRLLDIAAIDNSPGSLRDLGVRIMARRAAIAGAVEDVEGRS